jgi:FkbM family methyltransferase
MNPFFSETKARVIKLAGCLINPIFRRAILAHGIAAGIEHRHVLETDLATVVDIGANRGQFSLAARRWASKARVIAFEPLAGPGVLFRKVFEGDSKVILHKAAIGPETGEATMHVSAEDDSSSLLPISAMQERLYPGTGQICTETIKVGRLADFVAAKEIVPPALLKLDVQGFELEALKGCEDLLKGFSQVYSECSFVELYSGQALAHEIIAWLGERGFNLSGIYNMGYDTKGQAIQGDFFFQNRSLNSPSLG